MITTHKDSPLENRALAARLLGGLTSRFDDERAYLTRKMDGAIRFVGRFGLYCLRDTGSPAVYMAHLRMAIEHYGKDQVAERIQKYREEIAAA